MKIVEKMLYFVLALWLAPAGASECSLIVEPQSLTNYSEFRNEPVDSNSGFVTDAYNISPESVLAAYTLGVFPWGIARDLERRGKWYSPPERGVLLFDDLKISRSDRKILAQLEGPQSPYRVSYDRAFDEVVEACANMKRMTSPGTWIEREFIETWQKLHKMGVAHSVEVWRGEQLVGGNYGTYVNGVYSGESMFHLEDNVGKLALKALLDRLAANGHTWVDTQQAVGLSAKWGAKYVDRNRYLELLRTAQTKALPF